MSRFNYTIGFSKNQFRNIAVLYFPMEIELFNFKFVNELELTD